MERGFLRAHRAGVAVAAVLAVTLGIFAIVWFQPQKLFIEETVREGLVDEGAPSATATPSVVTLASGSFRSLEHKTTGTARLVRLSSGKVVLRFEGLNTSNGPDLRVYLSKKPSTLGWRDYGDRFIELGKLKGNIGDQNYEVPSGTDLSQYRSAVIWCVRFAVGFGVAPLDA